MLTPATLVPVVDHLEKKKLIKRQIDKFDRRRTPLILTPAGQKLMAGFKNNRPLDALANKLQSLGAKKSQDLLATLYELGAAVIGQENLRNLLKKADTCK